MQAIEAHDVVDREGLFRETSYGLNAVVLIDMEAEITWASIRTAGDEFSTLQLSK